jgi:hypothetical protein
MRLRVDLRQQEDGWWEARCQAIQGLRAEGETIGETLDYLQDAARMIYELCEEKGLVFVTDHPEVTLKNVIWQVEIPYGLKVA